MFANVNASVSNPKRKKILLALSPVLSALSNSSYDFKVFLNDNVYIDGLNTS